MPQLSLTAELAKHGPRAQNVRRFSITEAQAYCRRLARRHYENFTVASWLLPRELRQHFYNVYAYCRWADDLADEVHDPAQSLVLLDWWLAKLQACYTGEKSSAAAQHPVFIALSETILKFSIPQQPLADLLVAFRQDQQVTRYETFDDLLSYCRNSANPVGRIVLALGRCHDPALLPYSDAICTGLQLANFCQDVARDWDCGRVYLPQESLRAAGYTDEMFASREFNAAFRELMHGEVARAEAYLLAGRPLIQLVSRPLRLDVALFVEGGLSILRVIRRLDYNVWAKRPTVSKLERIKLLARSWRQSRLGAQP